MNKNSNGFTLIELMITIAIIAILAAIAIPIYGNHVRRAYYAEVMQATEAYRIPVYNCIAKSNSASGCNAGTNGIPSAITTAIGAVGSLSVTNGVITVTPVAAHGITTTDDYVLTPLLDVSTGAITWTPSGGGVVAGYATS